MERRRPRTGGGEQARGKATGSNRRRCRAREPKAHWREELGGEAAQKWS